MTESKASRGVFKVVAGTAAGQALTVIAAPVLSRLYTPADFGVLAVFLSIAMTLGTIAALRLEQAVPIPESDRDAVSLVGLGTVAAVTVTLLGTVAALFLDESLADALGQPQLDQWLVLAPVTGGVIACFMLLNQYAVRQGRFGAIGRRNFAQAATTLVVQVGLGLSGLKPGGLLLGIGIGQALGAVAVALGSGIWRTIKSGAWSIARLRFAAREHRRFIVLLTPAGLLNVLGIQVVPVLMSLYFGDQVTGLLGLTQRVLWIPVLLFGTAVAQVYLNQAAIVARAGASELRPLYKRTSRRLLLLGLIVSAPLAVAGPPIFGLAFGSAWREAGLYAALLAPSLLAQVVAFPLSQTLIVLGLVGRQAAWDAFRLVAIVLSVVVPAELGESAVVVIASFSVASTLTYVVAWWMSWSALQGSSSSVRPPTRPAEEEPPPRSPPRTLR